MTAPLRADPRHPGPSSESLQGRNPRDVGRSDAARSMGISTRSLRMRPLMTCGTERLRSRVVVATRLGSLGNRGARPIWSLRDAGSDERCCVGRASSLGQPRLAQPIKAMLGILWSFVDGKALVPCNCETTVDSQDLRGLRPRLRQLSRLGIGARQKNMEN